MSTTPNPARLDVYQARLAELVAARDTFRAHGSDHKVKQLNRQIEAQRKWIRRALATADRSAE